MKFSFFVVVFARVLTGEAHFRDSIKELHRDRQRFEVGFSGIGFLNGSAKRVVSSGASFPHLFSQLFLCYQFNLTRKNAVRFYYSGFRGASLQELEYSTLHIAHNFTELVLCYQRPYLIPLNDVMKLEAAVSVDALWRRRNEFIIDITPMSESVERRRFHELGAGLSVHFNFLFPGRIYAGFTQSIAFSQPFERGSGFYTLPLPKSRFQEYRQSTWVSSTRLRVGIAF